jgi:hypothetical protein
MRRFTLTFLILLAFVCVLGAEKLALDVNGYPMQFERYFTAGSDSLAASTTHDSLAIPSNAGAVTLPVLAHESGYIKYVTGNGENRMSYIWRRF